MLLSTLESLLVYFIEIFGFLLYFQLFMQCSSNLLVTLIFSSFLFKDLITCLMKTEYQI